MKGVMFGSKHSYDDFGLILSSKVINPPEVRTYLIDVPCRNGSIDVTDSLTDGKPKYKDRLLQFTFSVIDPVRNWSAKIADVENYLHGKRMNIIIDDDASFYYVGRVSVNEWKSDNAIGTLVIEATCEPFKIETCPSNFPWEWDSFDFVNGHINETSELTVSGTMTYVLICRSITKSVSFIASAYMSMTYNDKTFYLEPGTNKFYDLELAEGECPLTFKYLGGTATILINYVGASL